MARTTARNIAEDLVLFILDQAGGQLRGATRLQKIAFLLVMEAGVKGIAFEPGKYGPYSRDIEDAVRRLSDEGLINTWEEPIELSYLLMPAMLPNPLLMRQPGWFMN
ncbi:hypothetical protein [Vulcanisaeta sp. JCM 16159]|uniref:hypothetical protein n=1 Tax=Vulcanisaeta sp. JCM 16159 TaxID=1295371 RepID=UPI0006D0B680|nr:hypothetical protein [Vulcanisaeta sp. JCM 16159]